jgi:hypothetical protein
LAEVIHGPGPQESPILGALVEPGRFTDTAPSLLRGDPELNATNEGVTILWLK